MNTIEEKELYRYKVKAESLMHSYSSNFKTLEDAEKWYKKKGEWLEEQFDRKLILFKNDEIINN